MSHELKTKRPAAATKPPKAIVHLAFGSVPVVDDGVKQRLRAAAKRPRCWLRQIQAPRRAEPTMP